MRIEGSLVASLGELRAIEQQRIADEQAAIAAGAKAREVAKLEAERAAREEVEARAAAEHAARVRLEEARAAAEREARLQVEAADNAERARHAAELASLRFTQEMALRREEVRRERPRWMIAATISAVALAGGLAWFALDRHDAAAAADSQSHAARVAAADARRDANSAADSLSHLQSDLAAMRTEVSSALDRVAKAQTAAELAAAKRDLIAAQRHQADLDAAIVAAKLKREHDIRVGGVHLSEACRNNSLSKECLKELEKK